MWRWLVIVARDRPDLWMSWASFYGAAGRVDVLFDRRQAPSRTAEDRFDRRTRPHLDRALQTHGFLVIPRPEIVSPPC